MLYERFKKLISFFFNCLNLLMGGNLPPFTCASVIVEVDGRFLVIQRPNGNIAFPGGFSRWQEHPTQTARRECKEETGLLIHVGDLVGYQSYSSFNATRMSVVNLVFRGEVIGGKLCDSIEGHAIWLGEDELPARLNPFYQSTYREYLHNRK
jgi:ADP-ribose pyrophosphatase YjhB (NUDIX family)